MSRASGASELGQVVARNTGAPSGIWRGSTAIERGFADSLLASDSQTADPAAKAAAHETATVRATEHALLASGMTRTQARAHINQIKGKQDAAPEAKPGAGEPDWVKGAQQLIKTIEG